MAQLLTDRRLRNDVGTAETDMPLHENPADPDLLWILRKLVERTCADAGLLLRCFADGSPPRILVDTSVLATSHVMTDLMRTAGTFIGGERRRAGEGARMGWCDIGLAGGTRRAFIVALPSDGREQVVAAFEYRCASRTAEAAAAAMAERLAFVLEGYFRLWRRHCADQRQIRGLTAALDLNGLAIIVLDTLGEIAFTNRAATAMLDRADGLRRRGRSVAASDLNGAMRLQVAMHHVIADVAAGTSGRRAPVLKIARPGGGRPLLCAVLPVCVAPNEPTDAAIVLYLLDPDADLARLVLPLCKLYGLSPVECRLVIALAGSATLAEAARTMRVKEQTARAYLKQVFLKTATHRQADLVGLMLTSMIHVSNDAELVAL